MIVCYFFFLGPQKKIICNRIEKASGGDPETRLHQQHSSPSSSLGFSETSNEQPSDVKRILVFSIAYGFGQITISIAKMIKYMSHEASAGLFSVQQHTQNAVPSLINLQNIVIEKSGKTAVHHEDLEDSITMVRTIKECGLTIADNMIKDIKDSLVVMSTLQPNRGLIQKLSSSLQLRRDHSKAPSNRSVKEQLGSERTDHMSSTVFCSAKQKASNVKWPRHGPKESGQTKGGNSMACRIKANVGADELQSSSQIADESHEALASSLSFEEPEAGQGAKLNLELKRRLSL